MSGVSPVQTGGPVSSLPLSSPVSLPLKNGDDFEERRLRPTLSFRQKPEPPKLPPQLNAGDDPGRLRPTMSFRQKPEPPVARALAEEGEGRLRPTLSFRQKPEPPKVNFIEPPRSSGIEYNPEKQKQMQKTKSKIDMLSSLIREGGSSGQAPVPNDSSSDDESDDEALPQGTGGRMLIRPSAPPPPPPGLSTTANLPPLPTVTIKPSSTPPPPPPSVAEVKPAPPAAPPTPPPSTDDNAPENWTAMWSPEQNRNYFYNKKTGVSTWENPNVSPAQAPAQPPLPAAQSKTSRVNHDLEKSIHKKTLEKPDDNDVDIFGRGDDNRGSEGSGGSNSSGRRSLRATLSKALFGASAKKPTSPLRSSDSSRGSDSMPGAKAAPNPANVESVPQPTEVGSPAYRGNGSMISFQSVGSNESESSIRSHDRHLADKHVEVVAEVHTKSGRHTIVRAKKSKKKDHSMPIPQHQMPAEEGHESHMTLNVAPQVQQLQGSLPRVASSPRLPAGLPPTTYGAQMPPTPQPMAQNMQPIPQPMHAVVQPMQHFGAPHPHHMGVAPHLQGPPIMTGPSFLQAQPFAAYAAPPSPQAYPPQQQFMQAPPVQIHGQYNARYVQAIYDFFPSDPNNPSELRLQRGDVIQLLEQGTDGWWEGIHANTGRRGLFPGSHVQFIS